MERKIVTASLCRPQSHSETPRDNDVPLGFVNGAATSTNLLSQFPFPLLPPSTAPHRRCGGGHWVPPRSPQKARGRPLGISPAPHRRLGGGHRVPPRIPQKVRGRPLGTSLAPRRRCGGGKDIAGVVETYNRTIGTKTRGGKPGQSEE